MTRLTTVAELPVTSVKWPTQTFANSMIAKMKKNKKQKKKRETTAKSNEKRIHRMKFEEKFSKK